VICGVILALNYASIMFSEVIAPYNLHTRNTEFIYSPPQSIHLFHEGKFIGPFVYGRDYELDMDILKRNYPENRNLVQPLRFFCQGDSYRFWGLWFVRPRTAPSFYSAPIVSGVTCFRESLTALVYRLLLAWSG
jgi:peptide/nickel transport system permease protein